MYTHALVSLHTDCGVCLLLWAIWCKRRTERHILLWGIGQAALAFGSYLLAWRAAQPCTLALEAASLVVAQMSLLWGAGFLLHGRLPRRTVLQLGLVYACVGAGLYLLWQQLPDQMLGLTSIVLGTLILMAGTWIHVVHPGFRLLNLLLLLQGAFNVSSAYGHLPLEAASLVVCAILIKAAWLAALVNMVLRLSLRQHEHTIDNMQCGVALLCVTGRVLEVNRCLLDLVGARSAQTLLGKNIVDCLQGPVAGALGDFLTRVQHGGTREIFRHTSILHLPGRAALPVDVIASVYRESGAQYCTLQLIDVRERVAQEQRLVCAAQHDALTGLPNRSGLLRALTPLAAAPQSAPARAYLMLDIDRFKRVNDLFGYRTGDQLIVKVAHCLQRRLPPGAVLARLDGDQFGIVLCGDGQSGAGQQAHDLAQQVCLDFRQNIQLGSQSLAVSVSIGMVSTPVRHDEVEEALRMAEIAMFEAKRQGRAQVCVFDPVQMEPRAEPLLIDSALRAAIPQQQLRLVYQPIVTAAEGRLHKVEALVRWHSPALGDVSPDRFIPVAEESDMILALGAWILRQACAQLSEWGSAAARLIMSVNVSSRQLRSPDFLALVESTLTQAGVAPWQLELEVTERVLLEDSRPARQTLAALRQRGVRIALDDFGTGYSAMSYLTQFQFDCLKIDRSFIQQIASDRRMYALVSAIVQMGRQLDMELVAEGVETGEQLQGLVRAGCHCAQGFYISRPVAAEQILQRLAPVAPVSTG